MKERIMEQLEESARVKKVIAQTLTDKIEESAKLIIAAYNEGKKVLVMGNGGSAADAQHLAGELVGRFIKERKALPCLALTTDTSILTAIGNDYGYDAVFTRQVEAWIEEGDVVIAISTSGNSANILAAMELAKQGKGKIVALAGKDGGKMKALADIALVVPSDNTPRIQEAHITIIHILCLLVEEGLFPDA